MSTGLIDQFDRELAPLRKKLIEHPLFQRIQTVDETCLFMEAHVFAVWDFMSLLKSLQQKLTCTTIPWMPPKNREAARFINEIVVGEETDEIETGKYISHFELYLEAMEEAGADTASIKRFLEVFSLTGSYTEALKVTEAAESVRHFVHTTMSFCALAPHEVAAAFLYGREDIIPEMFHRILASSGLSDPSRFRKLKRYLERHIEVDGDSHGPMARRLMVSLCGEDPEKWHQAARVAQAALRERQDLWDGVLASLNLTDNALQELV